MKELTNKELRNINGGIAFWAAVGLACAAAAIYEHTKHFVVGLLNPYESNEK